MQYDTGRCGHTSKENLLEVLDRMSLTFIENYANTKFYCNRSCFAYYYC